MEMARTTSKPIILHKSNIGEGSRQIAKLHTAALANDDRIVETALKQAEHHQDQGLPVLCQWGQRPFPFRS